MPETIVIILILTVLITLTVLAFVPVVGLLLLSRRTKKYFETRKLSSSRILIAEYEPPMDLRPAQLGYLIDMVSNKKEYWATLLDLEAKGIIKIKGEKELEIIDEQALAHCLDYEKYLVRSFEDPSFSISRSGGITVLNKKSDFQSRLYMSLIDSGYFLNQKESLMRFSKETFMIMLILMAWLVFISWLTTHSTVTDPNGNSISYEPRTWGALGNAIRELAFYLPFTWVIYFVAAVGLEMFITNKIGTYMYATTRLRSVWPTLKGYQLYLNTAESERLNEEFKSGSLSPSYLKIAPYALVLNLVDVDEYISARFSRK